MLLTLADAALGYAAGGSADLSTRPITASVSADSAGSAAKRGAWVEARADVRRVGERMVFANCRLHAAGRRILRASAAFVRADAG